MHRNKIWIGFLIFTAFVALWFVGKASNQLIDYMLLSRSSLIEITDWSVEQIDGSKYQPKVFFHFSDGGRQISSAALLDETFPNLWACEKGINHLKNRVFEIWYNPAKPEMGILNKSFPYKSLLSAVSMIGLIIYFFCLGYYVSKRIDTGAKSE